MNTLAHRYLSIAHPFIVS